MTRKSGGNKSSKEDLQSRYDVGIRLIKEYKYKLSERFFDQEYKKRVKSELNTTITDNKLKIDKLEILVRILREEPTFEFLTKSLDKIDEDSAPKYKAIMPFRDYEKFLSAMYLVNNGNNNTVIFEPTTNSLANSSFITKAITAITETSQHDANAFSSKDILTLRIYFTPDTYAGFETLICDIYERHINSQQLNIISTSVKHLCCDIEFHYEDLEKILLFTYRLFGKYWNDKKK